MRYCAGYFLILALNTIPHPPHPLFIGAASHIVFPLSFFTCAAIWHIKMAGIVDYYRLLGLEKDASEEEIKRAYKRLVALYHPDKAGELSPKAREEFSEVVILLNKAKEILLDPVKRAEYDRMLGGEVAEGVIVGEVKRGVREEIMAVMGRLEKVLSKLQKEEGLMEFQILGIEAAEGEQKEVEMVLETEELSEEEPEPQEAIVVAEVMDEGEEK